MRKQDKPLARRWVVAVSVLLVVLLLVPARAFAASKPAAPTVQATFVAPRGETKLTWNKIGGAATYQIYRSKTKEGGYSRVHVTSKNYATWTDASLSLTGYWYKVRAVASDGTTGDFSTAKRGYAKIGAPSVTVIRMFSGKPNITWASLGVVKYHIYRSTSESGTYTKVAGTAHCNYIDRSVTEGETYYYKVRGVDKNGVYSNFTSPIAVTITPKTADQIRPVLDWGNERRDWDSSLGPEGEPAIFLVWEPIEAATWYKVYRSSEKNGTYTWIANVSTADSESFINNGQLVCYGDYEPDYFEPYYYKVYAVDGLGQKGPFSKAVVGGIEPYNPGD